LARHEAFFDILATLETDSVELKSVLAGLGTMRLVDAAVEDRRLIHADWAARRAARDAVGELSEGNPVRSVLARVLDEIDRKSPQWRVAAALVRYGRALDFDGRWTIAASVFEIAGQIATANGAWSVAVEAKIALGGSARRAGNWKKSNDGYAEALYLASGLGDLSSTLTVRIGMANTKLALGNLREADRLLSSVVSEANAEGLDEVASDALHSLSSVMHRRGDVGEAVTTAYEALRKASKPTRKDTILADIAAYFAELGMHDAARDAHMIVAVTARHQWVRWQATLNLMELAGLDGDEASFDRYASELSTSDLAPGLKAYFLLYRGIGCLRFGREEEGRRELEEAELFASLKGIHQVLLEAQNALSGIAGLMRAQSSAVTTHGKTAQAKTQDIAKTLSHLRELTLSSTQLV
jgi:tetratricopeptide (TPR) repeat protein